MESQTKWEAYRSYISLNTYLAFDLTPRAGDWGGKNKKEIIKNYARNEIKRLYSRTEIWS